MEEGLSLLQKFEKEFSCAEVDLKTYSPLTLAYIGDAIYDLMIRTVVVKRGNRATSGLHKTTSEFVKAETQANMIDAIAGDLTEEELAVYKRGRNAKSCNTAKNASAGDYRKATGFEALLGYLYLANDCDRAICLVKSALAKTGMEL